MASAYHHAPNHIRRMLNQLFFEHVYLVPDQDAGQIAATATCLPPFDSILGWCESPTDSEQTLPEGEESMKPLATDPQGPDEDHDLHSTAEAIASTTGAIQHRRPRVAATAPQPADYLKADQAAAPATTASNPPHTPQPPGAAQTLQAPRGHQVAGGHEVASTSPTTQPPNRPRGPKPPKTVQNKPFSTQKPTSEVSQDVGLSVECLVGPALSWARRPRRRPTTWPSTPTSTVMLTPTASSSRPPPPKEASRA